MSLDELKALTVPTRIEYADGLWTPGEPVKPKLSTLVRDATRSVSVVLRKMRRPKPTERPLTQSDIDARYEINTDRYSKRIHKRLMRGAAKRPTLFVSDSKILILERRDKR